jgi:hypothetical protein
VELLSVDTCFNRADLTDILCCHSTSLNVNDAGISLGVSLSARDTLFVVLFCVSGSVCLLSFQTMVANYSSSAPIAKSARLCSI